MNKAEEVVLETINLTKNYGRARGITEVNLRVTAGEIFGFIGPNGAGKSTTIRTILGLLFPDSGRIQLFGNDGLKNSHLLRQRIGFVPSELNYYDGLTVKQFLQYSADFYGGGARTRIQDFSSRLLLEQNRKIADLSLGNRKKVAIIQALLHQPELLILDEPTSGLDPLIQSRFYEILREEQQRGTTIFLSSHTLSEVEKLCSRLAIIREGRIIETSNIDELRRIAIKRFKLLFEGGITPENLLIEGISELKINEGGVEGLYRGDIKKLMKVLSELPVEDVVLEDPNLEEIFMHYYDGDLK